MGSKWVIILVIIVIIIGGGIYLSQIHKPAFAPMIQTSPTSIISTIPITTAPQAQNTVILTQNGFEPTTLTIKAGTTVTWTNNSGQESTVNSDPHPTHTDYPPLNLGAFADGQSLSLLFDKPGMYGYHNHLDPNEQGKILVK